MIQKKDAESLVWRELIRERTWPATATAVRLLLGPKKCPVGPRQKQRMRARKERQKKKEKKQLCFHVPFDAC